MSHDGQALHELCRRVAAGVPGAREEFSERVGPLMELLARRSLSSSSGRGRGRRQSAASDRDDSARRSVAASADRRAKIARLSSRLCRSLIEKVCVRHRLPGAETCLYRPPWPTHKNASR